MGKSSIEIRNNNIVRLKTDAQTDTESERLQLFEELTAFLPELRNSQYGEWVIDRDNDGYSGDPIQIPFVNYDRTVKEFVRAVYRFIETHQTMKLKNYGAILDNANIKLDFDSIIHTDVSTLDGKTVVALIIVAIRTERFCDGAMLEYFKNGSIIKWLTRLRDIDQN